MKLLYRQITVMIILLLAVVIGCGEKSSDVVAIIDGTEMSLDEYKLYYDQSAMQFPSVIEERAMKTALLDSLVNYKLLVEGAYLAGLDQDREVNQTVASQRTKFLFDELYREEVLPHLEVTEREVAEFNERMSLEHRFSHILILDKQKVDSVYQEIKKGADFAMLARTFSEDMSSAVRGGDLGFLSWAHNLAPKFRDIAFDMENGEISKPVKTEFGWHIIRKEEERKSKFQEFENSNELVQGLIQQRKAMEAEGKFWETMEQKAAVEINPDATTMLLNKLDKYYPQHIVKDRPSNYFPDPELLEPYEKNMIFATYIGGELTVANYLDKLANIQETVRPSFASHDSLKIVIFQLELNNIMEFEAEERQVDQNEEFIRRMTMFKESMMVTRFQKTVITRNVKAEENEVIDYYNNNLEDFQTLPEYHLYEIEQETEDDLKEIIRNLNSGEDFQTLARKSTTRPGMKVNGGDLGFVKDYRYPILYQTAKNLTISEKSDIIANARGYYSVIKLVDIEPARIRTIEECASDVKRIVLKNKQENAVGSWLERVRINKEIQIFPEVLEKTIDESIYEQN